MLTLPSSPASRGGPARVQLDFAVPLLAEFLRENHPLASFEEA